MACVAQWVLAKLLQTKLCGDFTYRLLFGGEEAKLILPLSRQTTIGILDDAGDGAVGKGKAPRAPSLELMRQQAEGISIPLEEQEVLPASAFSPNELLPALTIAFLEVSADSTLPAVPEGRIAHVVR